MIMEPEIIVVLPHSAAYYLIMINGRQGSEAFFVVMDQSAPSKFVRDSCIKAFKVLFGQRKLNTCTVLLARVQFFSNFKQ